MQNFKITLDNREYDVRSVTSDGNGNNNWLVTFNHGGVRASIDIPIEKKVTRAKAMLFIEAFHEGFRAAFESQELDQNYVMNQKNVIL